MTIRPGEAWGEVVERPAGLATVDDDGALARWIADHAAGVISEGPPAVAVIGGDLVDTVGGASRGSQRRRYPIDVLRVVLDDDADHAVTAVAHVVVRRSGRLGWWRGPVWAAMNVSRHGRWEVAPRAHPNDGMVDVVSIEASMSWRTRAQVARRLPTGAHLPHPSISVTRGAAAGWSGERPLPVLVDGRDVGRARRVEVTVVPDAATVHV
ncbi:MAG: hypothetical protein ACK5OX_02990 [Desertimonas sp.]